LDALKKLWQSCWIGRVSRSFSLLLTGILLLVWRFLGGGCAAAAGLLLLGYMTQLHEAAAEGKGW